MILNEISAVPSSALPVSEFSEHLHLGSGFADDGAQDSILEAYLRAAISAIEARTGKAIFLRGFAWTLYGWHRSDSQGLPLAPVQSVDSIRIQNAQGLDQLIDHAVYGLEKDLHFPKIVTRSGSLPYIGSGSAEVTIQAGFAPDWSGLPTDLQQAVLILASHYYENRQASGSLGDPIPAHVLGLLAPYQKVSLSGGLR